MAQDKEYFRRFNTNATKFKLIKFLELNRLKLIVLS